MGAMNEGWYLKMAKDLKRKMEHFEELVQWVKALAKVRVRSKLRQQGVTPPLDLSAYQKPCPANNNKKAAR